MKCVRCGTEWQTDKPKRIVTCPHCQQMMTLDDAAEKRLKHSGAFLIFAIATAMGYGLWDWSENGKILVMFISVTAAIILLNYINGLALRLTAWRKPLTYRAMTKEERDQILRKRNTERKKK